MGLLSWEFSISSTLVCEEVSSGEAETSAFGGGGMSVPAEASSPCGRVFQLAVVIVCHVSIN